MRRLLIAAVLTAAALLSGCRNPPPDGATVLTYASPYSPTHPFSRADKAWMTFVETRSQGRLKIVPIWSGTLLSSEQSMEELRHGVADVGLITPIYVRGGTHLIRTQSGFYAGAKTYAQQAALYRCLAEAHPQFARETEGLKVLAIQGGSLPSIVTRTKQVRTLEDLKGLRLRAPAELLRVLETLGADPVNLPMGEVYSAMAKGVIDGVIAPADTLRALHFAEVAKHFTMLEVPRGAYPARAMSLKRWNSLSAEDRAVLEEGIAVWEEALAREIEAAKGRGEATGREKGVSFQPISAEDQAAFDRLYDADAERNARALSRFGIDGMAVFDHARRIAEGIRATGTVDCGGGRDGSAS